MAQLQRSALVTGAASGIGREVARQLAANGYNLTLLDMDAAALQKTARELSTVHGRDIATAVLDVTDSVAQREAFQQHVKRWGGLQGEACNGCVSDVAQVAVLNAGIGERGNFFDPANDGWIKTLDVDLTAVLHGVRIATELMQAPGSSGGTILTVASAGAIFPMPVAPVYAASKAGVAHFVRSAGRGLARGPAPPVRLLALCPEFVETPLVTQLVKEDPATARRMLGSLDIQLLPPAQVAGVAADMIRDVNKYPAGAVVLVRQDGTIMQPYAKQVKTLGGGGGGAAAHGGAAVAAAQQRRQELAAWATANLPSHYKQISVVRLSSNFREATQLVLAPLPARPPAGCLLVKRVYAGVNASDVNYSAGRYHSSIAEAQSKLPFPAGFESVGVVVAAGDGVTGFAPGDPVACLSYGSFSEYGVEPARTAMAVPWVGPEVVALLTSGLTASIGLEQAGRITAGETVLVTAAAGGTGQFVVQLAKAAGCHVIATCGGPDKAKLLKELGADRVIDYRSESVKAVLKREYPRGVDVVWESVGGDMFSVALDALAPRGRLVIIGMMSSYRGENGQWVPGTYPGLAEKLLWKSASAVGFFLLKYAPFFKSHLARLVSEVEAGRLRVATDPRVFVGVEAASDAVEHLQGGTSVGKVVLQVAEQLPPHVRRGPRAGAGPEAARSKL